MAGTRKGDYPAKVNIPGVELDFLPDAGMATEIGYIKEHAEDMDVLVLHGPYPFYYPLVDCYRACRPEGKVYLELDLNRYTADRLSWDTAEFRRFLSQCTVVGASCRRIQRLINRKWPCLVQYIPNGFYNFDQVDLQVDFSRKHNVIMTVGRIGSPEKRNDDLVQAFAEIADACPDWKLMLVGPVQEPFATWLREFEQNHSELQGRIICTGMIADKAELVRLYQQAKIFVMTSYLEGGTPNVASEALFGGCYMVTSDVDGAPDMIGNGACGRIFPVGDVNSLAGILQQLCHDEERLLQGGHEAVQYAQRNYDFEKIVDRLYYLLFGEVPA